MPSIPNWVGETTTTTATTTAAAAAAAATTTNDDDDDDDVMIRLAVKKPFGPSHGPDCGPDKMSSPECQGILQSQGHKVG